MNHYQKAMAKRRQADEYRDEAILEYEEEDLKAATIYEENAMKWWQEHVQLLLVVYPTARPEHPIKVTLLDRFWVTESGQEMKVLETSFETLSEYIEAEKALQEDYTLETTQVGQCEMCDKYYFTENGYTAYKSGFCSPECLNEDELLRQIEAEDWEDQYAEHVYDSDPYDQDTIFF